MLAPARTTQHSLGDDLAIVRLVPEGADRENVDADSAVELPLDDPTVDRVLRTMRTVAGSADRALEVVTGSKYPANY